MLDIIRIAAFSGAILLGSAAWGQPVAEPVPLPTKGATPEATEAAELLYLEALRRAANNPVASPDTGSEDTISVIAERPSEVVCTWRRRNGSNFRERRCRTRYQAERERQQATHAIRRLRGF